MYLINRIIIINKKEDEVNWVIGIKGSCVEKSLLYCFRWGWNDFLFFIFKLFIIN